MEAVRAKRHQLDALADPTRRAILELLRERPLTAGEIAARFSQQRPAISKHLTLLRTTGWLAESRDRQRRIYSLRNDAVVVVVDWARRLGEATQGVDSSAVADSVTRGPVGENEMRDAGNESEISELKSQIEILNSKSQNEIPDLTSQTFEVRKADSSTLESSSRSASARSSFELIFD